MANLKEIVTKAVIGKTKKLSTDTFDVNIDQSIDTVLGCWIINHNFSGTNNSGKVSINGSYDVNVWYSYDNNTKTNVIARNYTYTDLVNVKLNNDESLTDSNEIIVRSLTAPQVKDVKANGSIINLTIEKDLGVEIVGDMKVRINVEDDYDDYDEDINEEQIDVIEDYLNGVNQN